MAPFCSINTQISQILSYSQFQQIRLRVKRGRSRNELQPCLRKGRETHLSQFLQSRRKAAWERDQNKPRFLAKAVDQNGIFHQKGSRGTGRRLGLIPRGGLHLPGTRCSIPIPRCSCSPLSSGAQRGWFATETDEKLRKGFPFPHPAPKLP